MMVQSPYRTDTQSNKIIKYSWGRGELIVKIYFIKFDISDQTAGADDDSVVGVDVGVVLGDLGVVGLLVVVSVAVRQLWRGGGLAQSGPVAAVIVTSHRATVALFRPQGRDVLVVIRTGQAENRHFGEKIFQSGNISWFLPSLKRRIVSSLLAALTKLS